MPEGILVLDKPQGFTSHDAVAKLRGILRTRRIGHAGTLDPMAEGVLVVLLGGATRASEYASGADKEYIARFRLGLSTDTQDITGAVLARAPVSATLEQVRACVRGFLGEREQIPPMYSAIQVDGKRLYDLARQGKEVERPSRRVTFHQLDLLDPAPDGDYQLRVLCSKGTYIRTLCHDIGQQLGCGACMTALRRVRSGDFTQDEALSFAQVERLAQDGRLESRLAPVDRVFAGLPAVTVNQEGLRRAANGAFLTGEHLAKGELPAPQGLCRVYGPDGRFLLLGRAGELNRGGAAIFAHKNFFAGT